MRAAAAAAKAKTAKTGEDFSSTFTATGAIKGASVFSVVAGCGVPWSLSEGLAPAAAAAAMAGGVVLLAAWSTGGGVTRTVESVASGADTGAAGAAGAATLGVRVSLGRTVESVVGGVSLMFEKRDGKEVESLDRLSLVVESEAVVKPPCRGFISASLCV